MESCITNISINGNKDEYYIHFNSELMCDKFILNNNVEIGHRCCSGKGVLL